jgi:hypothetical protein
MRTSPPATTFESSTSGPRDDAACPLVGGSAGARRTGGEDDPLSAPVVGSVGRLRTRQAASQRAAKVSAPAAVLDCAGDQAPFHACWRLAAMAARGGVVVARGRRALRMGAPAAALLSAPSRRETLLIACRRRFRHSSARAAATSTYTCWSRPTITHLRCARKWSAKGRPSAQIWDPTVLSCVLWVGESTMSQEVFDMEWPSDAQARMQVEPFIVVLQRVSSKLHDPRSAFDPAVDFGPSSGCRTWRPTSRTCDGSSPCLPPRRGWEAMSSAT